LGAWADGATTLNPISVFLTIICIAVSAALSPIGHRYFGILFFIVGIVVASALKMANAWQKCVILRAGKLRGVKGPGFSISSGYRQCRSDH